MKTWYVLYAITFITFMSIAVVYALSSFDVITNFPAPPHWLIALWCFLLSFGALKDIIKRVVD